MSSRTHEDRRSFAATADVQMEEIKHGVYWRRLTARATPWSQIDINRTLFFLHHLAVAGSAVIGPHAPHVTS